MSLVFNGGLGKQVTGIVRHKSRAQLAAVHIDSNIPQPFGLANSAEKHVLDLSLEFQATIPFCEQQACRFSAVEQPNVTHLFISKESFAYDEP